MKNLYYYLMTLCVFVLMPQSISAQTKNALTDIMPVNVKQVLTAEQIADAVKAHEDGAAKTHAPKMATRKVDVLPYENDFSTDAKTDEIIIIDANKDGRTWAFTSDEMYKTFYCVYSMNGNSDDWLVTPAIKLEKGKKYHFAFDTRSSVDPQTFEVKMGDTATVAGLITPVIPSTTITKTETYKTFESYTVTVEKTGYYHFGIHNISEAWTDKMHVTNLFVEESPNDKAPGPATNFVVTPDATGLLKAKINFTLPTSAIDGTTLDTSIPVVAVIERNGVTVTTVSQTPGTPVDYSDDNVLDNGVNTYIARLSHNGLNGAKTSALAYVGVGIPNNVKNLSLKDDATSIGFSWDKVGNVGQKGRVVRPDDVTYIVYHAIDESGYIKIDKQISTDPIAATKFDYKFDTNTGEQMYDYYGIKAQNAAGLSGLTTNGMLIGASYTLPFAETFASGGFLKYWTLIAEKGSSYAKVGIAKKSADNDGKCLVLYNTSSSSLVSIKLSSGKIALGAEKDPSVSFYVKGLTGSSVKVYGCVEDTTEELLQTITPTEVFAKNTVSLKDFKNRGKWLTVKFLVDVPKKDSVWVDSIAFYEAGHAEEYEYVDLGLESTVKWATMNIGATSPEDCGTYFAWGETEATTYPDWAGYKWGTQTNLTKYNYKSDHGVVDNKKQLDPEDDAARVIMGGDWRMPTAAEFQELIDGCTWTSYESYYVESKGQNMIIFKGVSKKNGKEILFPATGHQWWLFGKITNSNVTAHGKYWTIDLDAYDEAKSTPELARIGNFGTVERQFDGHPFLYEWARYCGMTIRAVCGENVTAISEIKAEDNRINKNTPVYDLNGRIVKNPTTRGIYIQNGRKFIVR